MGPSDSRQFNQLLTMLAVATRTEVTTALRAAYWTGLEDLELSDIDVAVKRCVREDEFMPPISRLRSLAKMNARQLQLFPPPSEAKRLEAAIDAEKQRIADTWKGHEDELEAAKRTGWGSK